MHIQPCASRLLPETVLTAQSITSTFASVFMHHPDIEKVKNTHKAKNVARVTDLLFLFLRLESFLVLDQFLLHEQVIFYALQLQQLQPTSRVRRYYIPDT